MKRTRASIRVNNFKEEQKSDPPLKSHQQNEKEMGKPKKKNKSTLTVNDLESIKDELQQVEDPPLTTWEKQISSSRLLYSFYDTPCESLAKNMLGKILVRKLDDGTTLKGKIVETESYLGIIDKASATFEGKVTPRNIPMYMIPGTIFVYLTYGMYHCFNISSQGKGSSVFLRAVEPLDGIERMRDHRNSKLSNKQENKDFKVHELCNGPSKLCIAFDITKEYSKYSMCSWKGMWIEDSEQEDIKIVSCPRVGIDKAGSEWANKPLRFYILGNQAVSRRDKKAESLV